VNHLSNEEPVGSAPEQEGRVGRPEASFLVPSSQSQRSRVLEGSSERSGSENSHESGVLERSRNLAVIRGYVDEPGMLAKDSYAADLRKMKEHIRRMKLDKFKVSLEILKLNSLSRKLEELLVTNTSLNG
jgi:hypothetical protein